MSANIEAKQEIMELERTTNRLLGAGDVDRMMDYMADDVMLLNPGSELLIGNSHERAALEAASRTEGLEMSFAPIDADVSASGDMAFAHGKICIKLPDGTEQTEKYVTVWKKTDNKWKVVLQARNSNS